MDAQHESVALLTLATRKGLIAQQSAATIKVQIESGVHPAGAKPVAELLVKEGHITAPQAELLLSEFAKAQGPKVIGGHQLVSKLGQGGMGAVFKAIQLSMQREVALKLLNPGLAKDKEFVERFVREARAAGKVVHAHVIACYDVGVDNGTPFMSLELVSGGDALKRANAAGGRLPEREGIAIIRDAALGLAAIDRAGLIHRDIKPANIFLTEEGRAKLADLGLARSTSGDDRMTQTGAAVGSPAYMSPEQAKGAHDLDIRTDIYSLGAALYHLLVGQPPFSASSVFATVAKVINDPVPDPRALNPSVSPAASAVIKKAMSKDRALRQQTPDELVADLEAVLAGKHPGGRSAPLAAVHPHAAHSHAPAAHLRPVRHASEARPGGLGMYLGLGIAAVVVLVVATMLMRGGYAAPPSSTTAATQSAAGPAVAAPPSTVAQAQPSVTEAKPAAGPAAESAREHPLRDLLRENARERIASRIEAAPPTTEAAPVVSAPPPAQPEVQSEPAAQPDWAAQAGPVLDAIYAGRLDDAATAAKALPKEFQGAVAQLLQARKDLPKVYQAQAAAIVAAKPALKSMPSIPDLAVVGATDKGIAVRNPKGMGTSILYDRLPSEDNATLRGILAKVSLEPWQARTLMHVGLTSAEALANADGKDPTIATLQRLAKTRSEMLAEEKRVADAAARAKASAAAGLSELGERTQRVIRNVAQIITFDPTILSGVVDRPVELRDLVLIRSGTTLGPNGRLIPTPGALVINATDKIGYEPVQVQGLPFISMSVFPSQSMCEGAADRGRMFTNCIFYGRALIDGQSSPLFLGCTFIGGIGSDAGSNRGVVWNAVQRQRQTQHCDFFRMRFQGTLPIADSDLCWFGQCDIESSLLFARQPVSINGWDANGAMQASLDRAAAAGLPRIVLNPAAGRPQTPFGADTPALARFLDATAAELVQRLR